MTKTLYRQWLGTLCGLLPGAHSAIFVVPGKNNNSMKVLATWPNSKQNSVIISKVVKYTLKKNSEVCIPKAEKIKGQYYDFYALPILDKDVFIGVIVIKIKHGAVSNRSTVFNALKQSVSWLALVNSKGPNEGVFYADVVGLLASCFEQTSYEEGLIKMVSELTKLLDCDRVAFAEFRQYHCRVIALSNSINFDDRSNLLKKIAAAMDESIEQDSVFVFPAKNNKLIQRAHHDLARKFGSGSICTIPLVHQQESFGAVTLLRSEEKLFDEETVNVCQLALTLLTPFLVLKKEKEKHLVLKNIESFTKSLGLLFGIRHLKLKLVSIGIIGLLVFMSLIEGNYRISANAILEGKIQRVVAAPISGYLLSAAVRAGDIVAKGEVMASLNDAELKLELTKLTGKLQKIRREYRKAQSERNMVNVRILNEQILQTKAELALNRQQLDAITLRSPFKGVVIEGDLSQMLGSPVERGDSLFKVAPLDGYRIILKVDESDIASVKKGQTGTLALTSLAEHTYPLTIEKITVVAKADDGANIFRVEASLDNPPELLRPGMQGVGKINVGKMRLLWIWTHEITDWFKLWVWSWWP